MFISCLFTICLAVDLRKHFYHIATSISSNWPKLAAALLIDYSHVEAIRHDYRDSVFDQAMQFLNIWYRQGYPRANINQLLDALQQLGRNDIVMKIIDINKSHKKE